MAKKSKDPYKDVYRILRKIPNGKVVTYGAISRKLGISPRYVGFILSRNDHPEKYPCFRVVRSDGSVGGYTINGKSNSRTSAQKRMKLSRTGVIFEGSKVSRKSILDDI